MRRRLPPDPPVDKARPLSHPSTAQIQGNSIFYAPIQQPGNALSQNASCDYGSASSQCCPIPNSNDCEIVASGIPINLNPFKPGFGSSQNISLSNDAGHISSLGFDPATSDAKTRAPIDLSALSAMNEIMNTHLGPTAVSESDRTLALLHLRKIFTDFSRSQLDNIEYESRLYRMLPLFYKITMQYQPSEIRSQFKEILQFATHVAKLFVQEIRKRASNQSTETAAVLVAEFLEPEGFPEPGKGWLLLRSLHYFSQTKCQDIVQRFCDVHLPSTLAKCMYLFYDLPVLQSVGNTADSGNQQCGETVLIQNRGPVIDGVSRNPATSSDSDSNGQLSPLKRRSMMRDTFVDLLASLCSFECSGEELARKDDLALLFSTVSSWCPAHNAGWRKATAEVLMALSSRTLNHSIVSYLHKKSCLSLFLDNIRVAEDISIPDKVEMFVCLFCLLKDSSSVTPILLQDFKEAKGYQFLVEFLLRNEKAEDAGSQDALRNLLLMFSTGVTAGYKELKSCDMSSSLYQLPGFALPQPSDKGCSVRNFDAFQVLQNVFLRSEQPKIGSTILDVINSIYCSDFANYFILEQQCTLGQFAEVIYEKSDEIQSKYFDLLEFIVFQLNYVPCKELIALSVFLKTQKPSSCHVLCIQSLLKIFHHHSSTFKDVYREVGLLEVLILLMQEYSDVLRGRHLPVDDAIANDSDEHTVGFLAMDMLTLLLKGNQQNANVFRECGGSKIVQGMIAHERCRLNALLMLQQLLLLSGGEEELAALLGLMHSSDPVNVSVKTQILKSLLFVLRESHRVRLAFRKVGGFLYVMSTLVTMEGALSPVTNGSSWASVSGPEVLDLLKHAFKVITIAMRFEPANARFFQTEVRFESITESLRLIGCFDGSSNALFVPEDIPETFAQESKDLMKVFSEIFLTRHEVGEFPKNIPESLTYASCIIRLLYDMSLDNFEKPPLIGKPRSPSVGQHYPLSSRSSTSPELRSAFINGSNLIAPAPAETIVVHPGAVLSILKLLPCISSHLFAARLSLQVYVGEILKSLMRSERNQQVMCDAGFPAELFRVASSLLVQENHPLLGSMHYMLERLAAQGMRPKELRELLRLDLPLCCRSLDDEPVVDRLPSEGGPLPLNRVKTLVSMMTPRNFRIAGVCMSPPFIEFDMSVEGFGCISLPSVAPQSAVTGLASGLSPASLTGEGASVVGGIGSGERIFPPLTGLTFCCWLYVDKFSDPRVDSHPIRLLTIVRTVPVGPKGSEETVQMACLAIQISPVDRALLVATHETDTPAADLDRDVGSADCFARIPVPDLHTEQQWHHLAVVLNRSVLKNSTASVYLNGVHQSQQKLHYIIQNPGGGATTLTTATSVCAFVGTPPGPHRRQSQLMWRLGTTYLIDETLSAPVITTLFRLGPHYVGCFQCPVLPTGERLGPLINEEKISFGLHAGSVSHMTLAKLRRVYNKTDSKILAKQLGISSHENATPIRVIHNAAGNINGPARTIGGVLIGYLGMRTFCPKPVARLLESVGGHACVLGLVAMASSTEELYAAVKALLCAIRSNRIIANEMDRVRGYQTLSILLKEKHALVNTNILHLIFSLAGTLDSSRETTQIQTVQSFEDLLCDLEVWRKMQPELHRLLYEHFYELITESGDPRHNLQIIRSVNLLPRLLFMLDNDLHILSAAKDVLFNLLSAILQPLPDVNSLAKFGQYIASTLPNTVMETEAGLPQSMKSIHEALFAQGAHIQKHSPVRRVYIRNRCLNVIVTMLCNTGGHLNLQLCELVVRVLGFDWVTEFFAMGVHPTTVALALRILMCLLSHGPLLAKFKEGSGTSGWLTGTESVVQNKAGSLLGFSVSAHGGSVGSACDINPEICHTPGFAVLSSLLPYHCTQPEVYLALLSLVVGRPAKQFPQNAQFDLDSIWSLIFGIPSSASVADAIRDIDLCVEAVPTLMALCRNCMNSIGVNTEQPELVQSFPSVLLQFAIFLYHNVGDFTSYCMTDEFLASLVMALFPDPVYSPVTNAGTVTESNPSTEDEFEIVNIASPPSSAVDISQSSLPARKQVTEFLKNILVDCFAVSPAAKGDAAIDTILDVCPDTVSASHATTSFVTTIFRSTMEHLVASDVLLYGNSSSLPLTISTGSNYQTLAGNIFYFTSRLVDCLWNRLYNSDPQEVLEFCLKLLSQVQQAKRKTGGVPTDALIRSLNRTILCLLSRAIDNVNAQHSVLEGLQKITANRAIIFGPTNNDPEFLGCLAHLLFMLSLSESAVAQPRAIDNNSDDEKIRENRRLVSNAANRVWEELYLNKKQVLEDNLKIVLVPEINAAMAVAGEAANRAWQAYLDTELRGQSRDVTQIHAQLQSKIQKVTGGLSRLASRKTRPNFAIKPVLVDYKTLELWMRVHVSLVQEYFQLQCQQYMQWHEHVEHWCLAQWHAMEKELTRERGLWGPAVPSQLDKWMLDSTEGPSRMRKKAVRNDLFYINYPYRPSLELPENRPLKYKVAVSRDSKLFYERVKARRKNTFDARIVDASLTVATPSEDKPVILKDLKDLNTIMMRRGSISRSYQAAEKGSKSAESDGNSSAGAAGEEDGSYLDDVDDENGGNGLLTTEDSPDNGDEVAGLSSGGAAGQRVGVAADASARAKAREGSVGSASGDQDSVSISSSSGMPSRQASLTSANVPHTTAGTPASAQNAAQNVAKTSAITGKGPDNQTLLRLLEEGEELQSMFRCARVNGLDTCEGLLLFGKEHYYVVDGYTLLKTREIRDLDFLPEEFHDPIIPYTATSSTRVKGERRVCDKFSYEDIREVHKRRYLLQPIALEVFSADGRDYLLSFPRKTRNKVYQKFLSVAKGLVDGANQSVSGQKTSANVESSGSLLSSILSETSVTQRWVRGEISNFSYLQHLNTLAGRSYNDLMQYPVFPWILRNYESEELDLTDPSNFRDLTKPMGAQTEERLGQFLKRYREWDDPSGETPPYMYGTHYSSAMIVVSYLIRIEPFTQQFLKLQGGHFDLADRMFHSIHDAYYSAAKNNMADVKELIPEFFYLPEFLENKNNYDLGTKQSGIVLGDVVLPGWAKGDAREFIRMHREALECDFVSLHLHEWIDLIFGFKQQGPAAVESNNLYHHLFYEGNVDFDAIDDPLTRNATIGFINNFGQIPSQLFKKPHPSKKLRLPDYLISTPGMTTDRLFYHCLDSLKPPAQPIKELKGPVGQVVQTERGVLCAVEMNKVLVPTNFAKYIAWGFPDKSLRLGTYESDKSVCIHEMTHNQDVISTTCPNNRMVVTGGTSTVVCVWEVVSGVRGSNVTLKLRKPLYGHTESISCLTSSGNYGIVLSGSEDRTCIVWDLSSMSFIRQLGPHPATVSAIAINELTGDIATCSGTYLFVWDINGRPLASVNTSASPKLDSKQTILCVAFSEMNEWDPQNVIMVGSNDGVVRLWTVEYVQVPEDNVSNGIHSGDSKMSGSTSGAPSVSSSEPGSGGGCAPAAAGPGEHKPVNQSLSVGTVSGGRSTFVLPPSPGSSVPNLESLRDLNPETLRLRLMEQEYAGDSRYTSTVTTPEHASPVHVPRQASESAADSGLETPASYRSELSREEAESGCSTPGVGHLQKQGSTDSFVFLNKDGLAVVRSSNKLKKGFKWQIQLVFRSKLTMHTAFERKDNPNPASITSLSCSRDHKTIYVGDSKGRLWAWTVGESGPGGRADHWVQDPARQACTSCCQRFTSFERKHHCRNCGQIFCAKCSRFESEIKHMKISKPVRVCQQCFAKLKSGSAGS